jgi:hypothetical protein
MHRRTLVTERHNNLMQVVMDLARSVGFHVRREPNDHIRPDNMANPHSKHYNDHADILLVKHAQRIYVDVTVTRPTCSSNLHGGGNKVRTTPAHSTHTRTRMKHRKYDGIAACNRYQLLAFTMETYGGLGEEALELLHILSKHCKDEYSERQFLSHAFRRLSVTLQTANANIQSRGVQIMQMDDYAGLLAVSPSSHSGHRQRRSASSHHSAPSRRILSVQLRRPAVRRRLFISAMGQEASCADGEHDDTTATAALGYANSDDAGVLNFDYAASLCHADIAATSYMVTVGDASAA